MSSLRDMIRAGLEAGRPMIHFSIDDCILGLRELFLSGSNSAFDTDYFGFLRTLHEKTGVVITCFLFEETAGLNDNKPHFNLGSVTGRYAEDFHNAAGWLRFGVHGKNYITPMSVESNRESTAMVERVKYAVRTFTGGLPLAKSWRPHYYTAPREVCDRMREYNVEVLLMPEDSRKIVACVRPAMVRQMTESGVCEDGDSGFLLLHTSFAAENPKLTTRGMQCSVSEGIEQFGISAFFTHEYQLVRSGSRHEEVRRRVMSLLAWANRKECRFIG